jgi:hypothetical protein
VSFLEPLFLLLTGAAAVPLVLHLMRRRIHVQVDFPAVRYLARAERENVRQLKMRNLLLMILRVLAVLFLALAAARPLGALLGAGHVPTALAIVLDNSMSTGAIVDGQPLVAALRGLAGEAADEATGADRLWLVTAEGRVVGGEADAVREAIDRTDVFPGRGDMASALTRAGGLVSGAGLPARQVVVVTDGQATTWEAPVSLGDVRVSVLAMAGAAPANRAVVIAEARPVRWTPRGTVVARAEMRDSATYRIALGDTRLASGTARGGEDISIHAGPAVQGWRAGLVELEPDELRTDDVRHFAVWVGAAPAVRPDASAGAFVRTAVDALVQNGRVRLGEEVLLASADAAPRLPALLVPPSDPTRIGAANRALERLGVPWRFGSPRRDETEARGVRFTGVRVALRYPLTAQAGAAADTLATVGGEAWAVGGDRYVVLGSPLDPGSTDLPVSAGFVPWLGDMISQRLAGEATTVIPAEPGGRLRLPLGVDGIEGLDGQVAAVSGEIEAPVRPGVYFVRRGPDRVGAIVVNPEPPESDLRRLSASDLRARFRGARAAVTDDPATWRRTLFDTGSQRPLQIPLIVLALLALAAETYVVRRADHATATT